MTLKEYIKRRKIRADRKIYERNFDRFGNAVLKYAGRLELNHYQKEILRSAGFSKEQINEWPDFIY